MTRRNKKCLFLSCFVMAVRKKDMANKPVKKIFLQTGITLFLFVDQAAYRRAALYLASRCMHMPMSILQKEKWSTPRIFKLCRQ